MKVTIGEAGLKKTWQTEFPKITKCKCGGEARIAFVAHEGIGEKLPDDLVRSLHPNKGRRGGYWLHSCCAVAVYFCPMCLEPTALYNQG